MKSGGIMDQNSKIISSENTEYISHSRVEDKREEPNVRKLYV